MDMNYKTLSIPDYAIRTSNQMRSTFIGLSIGLITISLNLIAIVAILKIKTSLPVNIRLVFCLVSSDLLVSFVVVFESSIRVIFHYNGKDLFLNNTTIDDSTIDVTLPNYYPCFAIILHVLRYTAYNGTLLSLTALATDMYIAIIYPLSYTTMVQKNRVNYIIGSIFGIALLLGSCVLYLPMINQGPSPPSLKGEGYCFERWHQHMKSTFATFAVILFAIIIVTYVYVTVFYAIKRFNDKAVRNQQGKYELTTQVQSTSSSTDTSNCHHHPGGNKGVITSNNLKRSQRGLTTTLILLLVFLCCFLPTFIQEIYLMSVTIHKVDEYRYVIRLTELLLNLPLICSALNPLLYSYRLKDIKLSYLRFFCCYNDHSKLKLPLVAGRARPRHNVQVYKPIKKRNVNNNSPSRKTSNVTPWSQQLVKVTGIYIERIRKYSSTQSQLNSKCRNNPFSSAPFNKNEQKNNNYSKQTLLENDLYHNKMCYTAPSKLPVKSSKFISPPKMVLCPWQFANRSLRNSWLKEEELPSTNTYNVCLPEFEKNYKFSNCSSTEGGHSGSIDSANTNSTSVSSSFHHQRSKSIDNSSLQNTSSEKKRCPVEKSILEIE